MHKRKRARRQAISNAQTLRGMHGLVTLVATESVTIGHFCPHCVSAHGSTTRDGRVTLVFEANVASIGFDHESSPTIF